MEIAETAGTSMETIGNSRKRKADEDQRRKKRLKMIKERERNFFNFVRDDGNEEPSGVPLDLDTELQIYHKMHEIVLQDMKKHFDVPFVRDRLMHHMKCLTVEEFAERELEFYVDSLKHPGILEYKYLKNGKFSVYRGRPRKNWYPECINGTFEVGRTTLSDPPPEDPLEDYNF